MLPSVRAFMTGIIDYAGLFPPAQLPLDEAIRRYARYRTEADSWMLGRFVCPAERLSELAVYQDNLLQQGDPFAFAVLVTIKSDAPLAGILQWGPACKAIQQFRQLHGPRVVLNAVEARLPARLLTNTREHRQMLSHAELVDDVLAGEGLPLVMIFYEYEPDAHWRAGIDELIGCRAEDPLRRRGYKLRCGGLHASTIPSVEQVAHVIAACCQFGVPLKFTAGLHHPLRHYDTGVQAHTHGFLNVFAAGVLAHARNLSDDQIREIVADEDAGHFRFTDDGFAWKDIPASVDEITVARQQAVISFGSCSFDEPRDDLRKLGHL